MKVNQGGALSFEGITIFPSHISDDELKHWVHLE